MTREEILKKIELQEAKEKDLIEYLGVRNIEGVEVALEEKFSKPEPNMNYIYEGFEFIYKAREQEKYSPLEEKYRYYSIVLPAFYGTQANEAAIITGTLGVFEGLMLLERLLKDKEEVKYFETLYAMYISKRTDVALVFEKYSEKALNFIAEKMDNLKIEDLQKLGNVVMSEIEKLVTKVG